VRQPLINGLGRISSPLGVANINGEPKLVVHPLAAIGTDTIGLGVATALFFSTKSTLLKIFAALGGTWMIVAAGKEIYKMAYGPELEVNYNQQEILLPSGPPATWTAEHTPSQQRVAGRRPAVIFMR